MTKPVHVLHVLGGVGLGGAESRIMDLYRQMDREEIQFDFLVHASAVNGEWDRRAALRCCKGKMTNMSENRSSMTRKFSLWEDISMCFQSLRYIITLRTEER